jgi:hypothetical protein
VRQLYRRSGATGQIQLPAVPGLIDEYVTICDTLFAGIGRKSSATVLRNRTRRPRGRARGRSGVRTEAAREGLDVRVIQRDVFATIADLRRDYQLILLSEVVSDFRTAQQLRGLFELASHCLATDGLLPFNAFLKDDGYEPDDAIRELGQQSYTSMFTPDEMATAAAGLPLRLLSDDSVHDYEKDHLPDGARPPTNWYPNWSAGLDVFDLKRECVPIDMRWLVYGRIS